MKINKISNYRFRFDFIVGYFISERLLNSVLIENVFDWILLEYLVSICVQIVVEWLKWNLQNVFVSAKKIKIN